MRPAGWLRTALTGVFVLGAVAFVTTNGSAVSAATAGLRHVSIVPLVVGSLLSGFAVLNRAAANRSAHLAVGLDVPAWSMARPATAGFAADKVVRSGGASGVAVLVRHGVRRGYPHGSVLAACLLTRVASLVALGLLMLASISALLLGGHLTVWWFAAAIGFVLYTLIAAGVAVTLARRRGLARRLWSGLERRAPRLATAVGNDPITEFGAALGAARSNGHHLRRTLGHAVAAKALGIAMLLAAAQAAGVPIGPTGALVAYATALLASMASITPGGLGAVEASTTAMLVASGAGLGAAAFAVALFRILDLWLPVLAGLVAARTPPERPMSIEVLPVQPVPILAGRRGLVTP